MEIVKVEIKIEELKQMAENMFGDFVKAVVDIEKKIMVVDAGLHSDEEALLLESGSEQNNLWGVNLYPIEFGSKDFVEFDSMINLRPSWGNKTRSIDDVNIQEIVLKIINKLVVK